MPDDGLTPELRAELSAIVADLEAGGRLLDARGRPPIRWRDIGPADDMASFIMPSGDPIEAEFLRIASREAIERWKAESGLLRPRTPWDDLVTIDATAMPDPWATVTTPPEGGLYQQIVELYQRMERDEQARTVPYGHPDTWTVVEASAGTLPDGIAMAVVSPMGIECALNGCKHTHMVLLQEPDQPDDETMKEPEVYRREAAWWRRRWTVVSRHAGTRRFWTRWRANRWARQGR